MENKIIKPTWTIHVVVGKDGSVSHTHGLNKYGSLELELNLPLIQERAMEFLNVIGFEIANGRHFKDGDIIDKIFNCKIAFKEVEGIYGEGETNLRVILPDPNYNFPWDEGCISPYKEQI